MKKFILWVSAILISICSTAGALICPKAYNSVLPPQTTTYVGGLPEKVNCQIAFISNDGTVPPQSMNVYVNEGWVSLQGVYATAGMTIPFSQTSIPTYFAGCAALTNQGNYSIRMNCIPQ